MNKNTTYVILLAIILIFVFYPSWGPFLRLSIIGEEGFEGGFVGGGWTTASSTGETCEVITTDPYRGSYHARFTMDGSSTGEYARATKTIVSSPVVYSRMYAKILGSLPDPGQTYQLMRLIGSGGYWISNVYVRNYGGTVQWGMEYRDGAVDSVAWDSAGPALNMWYSIELCAKIDSTAGEYRLYIDDAEKLSRTGKNSSAYGNVLGVRVGEIWSSGQTPHIIDVDCVEISDEYVGLEEPPSTPTQGTLSVNTAPINGEVFVDGVSWGNAPQSRTVNAGGYTVTFGDVSGYTKPSSRTVTVSEGQKTEVSGTYIAITPPEEPTPPVPPEEPPEETDFLSSTEFRLLLMGLLMTVIAVMVVKNRKGR